MRINKAIFIAGVATAAFVPSSFLAAPEAGQEPAAENPPAKKDARELVGELASESYDVREQATAALWEMGASALPALRVASGNRDPEVADRAGELLLYITAGVLPDSPEEVKALVIRFSRSNVDQKLTILRKLTELGQWRQVLHLARLEKDDAIRRKMSSIVQKTAGDAARKAIAGGKLDLAGEILELVGDDDQSLAMRAWYYKHRGELPKRLKAAAQIPGKKGIRWRLALHRADGNIAAAIQEATRADEPKMVAALKVLQGNPLPWLLMGREGKLRLEPIADIARRIQIAQLRGDRKRAVLLARELVPLAQTSTSTRRVVIALAGTGFRKMAIDLLVKREPDSAFVYFDNMEAPRRCLDMLDIPRDAKPPYTDWVKKFTEEVVEQEDDDRYRHLIMLAGFLVRHGEGQHAVPVLTPLMTALEEDGSDEWFDLLYYMAIYDLGEQAIHFIAQRGNEDGEADLAVKKLLRSMSSDSLGHIWDALKKRNNQQIDKALRELGLLSGLIQDGKGETKALHKALLAEAAADEDIDQTARTTALFSFAEVRGDLLTCSELLNLKAPADKNWLRAKHYYDKELLKWAEVEPHYAKLVKDNPGDYKSLTQLYICSRQLGKKKQAEGMLDRILLLSMGSPQALYGIASELNQVGYLKEAAQLWEQAAIMEEPGGRYFDAAIAVLAAYPQYFYDSGQWAKIASISEVYVQLQMQGSSSSSDISDLLRARFKVEFARGMYQLQQGEQKKALITLDAARKLVPGDGTLADHFFPALRKANLGSTYDQWFNDSYRHVAAACTLYPGSHNSHNTAAWLASRAVRKLDAAFDHASAALKQRPHQGAYLDTMAEVWFARGDRAKAVDWSEKAVQSSLTHPQGALRSRSAAFANFQQLTQQLERFKKDPVTAEK